MTTPSGIALDSSGNAYVTGGTDSANFPTTAGAFQRTKGAGQSEDVFVTKINPQGSALVYSTYLGSSEPEGGFGIAVDGSGSAYVTGITISPTFPTTPGAFQATYAGGEGDAFVTKLNPEGSALAYSTFLGGTSVDLGFRIAVDSSGNAFLTGVTVSTNFPTANPLQPASAGRDDAFVTKLNSSGTALLYSTYLGGNNEEAGIDIAIDALGNAYVTGTTTSTNFPLSDPLQPLARQPRRLCHEAKPQWLHLGVLHLSRWQRPGLWPGHCAGQRRQRPRHRPHLLTRLSNFCFCGAAALHRNAEPFTRKQLSSALWPRFLKVRPCLYPSWFQLQARTIPSSLQSWC